MTDDTHDKIMKAVLSYLKASEEFEKGPSHRTKRNARRELRYLMQLAKQRQDEIQAHYQEINLGYKQNQKWQNKDKRPTT